MVHACHCMSLSLSLRQCMRESKRARAGAGMIRKELLRRSIESIEEEAEKALSNS